MLVPRHRHGLAFLLRHAHRHDLFRQPAGGDRRLGALLRAQREGILVGPPDDEVCGDVLRRLRHRIDAVKLAHQDPPILVCTDLQVQSLGECVADAGAIVGRCVALLALWRQELCPVLHLKRIAQAGSLRTHDVRVPGILVDYIVEAPDQWQTTQTPYDPAISGRRRESLLRVMIHAGDGEDCACG